MQLRTVWKGDLFNFSKTGIKKDLDLDHYTQYTIQEKHTNNLLAMAFGCSSGKSWFLVIQHLQWKIIKNVVRYYIIDDFGDHAAIMDFSTKWGKLDFGPAQKTVINTGKGL